MKVSELMNPKGVLLYAKIDNSADALGILVELQEGIGVITNGNAYYNAVSYRETFGGTTAIGGGIALPHACNAGVSAPGISALLLRRGVDWGAPDWKHRVKKALPRNRQGRYSFYTNSIFCRASAKCVCRKALVIRQNGKNKNQQT